MAVEKILKWCVFLNEHLFTFCVLIYIYICMYVFKYRVDQAHGIKHVCLRYFNACGADESGEIGEDHADETHLIPLILQVPLSKRESISIFGTDYRTPDGTCIRDYVHVSDIAMAHIHAVEYLEREGVSDRFNLGSGKGFSVKEIVEAARRVTGHAIPAVNKER